MRCFILDFCFRSATSLHHHLLTPLMGAMKRWALWPHSEEKVLGSVPGSGALSVWKIQRFLSMSATFANLEVNV